MAKKITDKVTWVGKIDWELVYFHGHELSTYKGSSYNSYLVQELFSFGEGETYVDLGAYNGDTVQEFLQLTRGRYKKIFALEPDEKNFKKLTEYVQQNEMENVECIPAGVWNECGTLELTGNGGRQSTFCKNERTTSAEIPVMDSLPAQNIIHSMPKKSSAHKKVKTQQADVVSVDSVLGNGYADYMKFDVEGVEKEALEGAAKHLIPGVDGKLPKLLIAAYHHDEDIFALPLLLWKLQPAYKIYLRKHPYVPAWEINIFAK